MNTNDSPVIIEPESEHKSSIIWLHGLGADGHDFEPIVPELRLPAELGLRFVFPNAPVRPVTINGGLSMRAWYDVRAMDLTREEDEESIRESQELVNDLIQAELDAGISHDKIILAGFSQGGAITLFSGLRLNHQLAGLLALSTYLPLPETLLEEASEEAQKVPIIMMHGTFDPVIPLGSATHSRERLSEMGYYVEWKEYPMQHSLCPEQLDHINDWIKQRLT